MTEEYSNCVDLGQVFRLHVVVTVLCKYGVGSLRKSHFHFHKS